MYLNAVNALNIVQIQFLNTDEDENTSNCLGKAVHNVASDFCSWLCELL